MTTALTGTWGGDARTLERNCPDLVPDRPRTYVPNVDILTDVLDRVRLKGTVLFHYEFGSPWSMALPRSADAIFHYLSRGSAGIALADGPSIQMAEGDFVLVVRGEPHVLRSGRSTKPIPLVDLDRWPAHVGVVHHGGGRKPFSTMICGRFSLARPSPSNVLELLPPVLHLRPAADREWLETILQRMVTEAALRRPGQLAVLSRMTEVLFVEVLRSWIKSLGPGEGGWLGAIADRHIGKALQLIHEQPEHPWTLGALGRHAGLGRSAFAARFTRLVGQPVHRYLVARRMDEAALMLESGDDAISRIATRVGYETTTAFSKAFKQHYSFSPGRYRERGGTGPLGSPHQHVSAST
jgi:AraC-like DNA-binding protein